MDMKMKAQMPCFNCKRVFPFDSPISGELIRSGIAEIVKKRDREWNASCMLCPDCLDFFRSEYIEDALEEEKGELSLLDLEVIASLREQEILAENLNLSFEKNLTLGQFLADKVANFGGSWTFIFIFFIVLVVWMGVNTKLALSQPFDPYPISCSTWSFPAWRLFKRLLS